MKKALKHIGYVTVGIMLTGATYAVDDNSHLDGVSSFVISVANSNIDNAPAVEVAPASHTLSSCDLAAAEDLQLKVAGLGTFFEGLESDLPISPAATPIADKVAQKEQSMIAEISSMENELEESLKAQIAALDAESAKLTSQLNALKSKQTEDRDNKALEAIQNAEAALATARAALKGQR